MSRLDYLHYAGVHEYDYGQPGMRYSEVSGNAVVFSVNRKINSPVHGLYIMDTSKNLGRDFPTLDGMIF